MNSAIVAITIDIGYEGEVMDLLCADQTVHECYMVYGVYDIIAKVHAEGEDGLHLAIRSIREMRGVRSTLTLVVCREHKK
ncbi:MAG: Lrp/AsnC family transcriptional regulator [Methanomassiliicoccales archaeon]|nr:Lrp/AsnC family transcriptional regulator [Methanomassiliicoccales archaeon]